jgi:hypothetical protein
MFKTLPSTSGAQLVTIYGYRYRYGSTPRGSLLLEFRRVCSVMLVYGLSVDGSVPWNHFLSMIGLS